MAQMIAAINKELFLQKSYLTEQVDTIYFGGGTPSLVPMEYLDSILQTIHAHFRMGVDPEITLEVNPEDVSLQKIEGWKNAGINRVSIGIQSFEDKLLKYMNRAHTSEKAKDALELISKSFDNYNLDIIYGIPNASQNRLANDIEQALTYAPQHISAYALTIEPKTVFGHREKKGQLQAVDDDLVADEFMLLHDRLSEQGYDHYEVSNYALPGFVSHHNSGYWKSKQYLGIGPSAHTFNGDSRQYNVPNNQKYMQALEKGDVPATFEHLSVEEKVNDYLLTSLRTKWGISFQRLRAEWGYDLETDAADLLQNMVKQGLARMDDGNLFLTTKGFLLADQLAMELFL